MKKQFAKIFALSLAAMGISFGVQADVAAVYERQEIAQSTLSAEEQNFASILNEQAKEVFSQLSAEQRKKAMTASEDSKINPNDAVQAAAKEFVAQAD